MLRTIQKNYARAPFYSSLMPWIKTLIERKEDRLSEYNIANIREIAKELRIKTRFVCQSQFTLREIFDLKGSERLASICQALNAEVYLAGDGAEGYEELSAYQARQIQFKKLNFEHPVYTQTIPSGGFIPGLSVVDALLNLGVEGTREVLGL